MKKLLIYAYILGFLPIFGCPTCAHPMYENEEYTPLFFTDEYYQSGKKYYQVDAPSQEMKDTNEKNVDSAPATDSE
jgi:hypothetical protein